MGAFGAGLYANDFALDLRPAIRAVLRLPLSDAELVEVLRGVESGPADNPADPDHTLFWLVLADQMAKRGVYPAEVVAKALAIIGDGSDLANLAARGAGPAVIKQRAAQLEALRAVLETPMPRERKTIAKPQPLLLGAGEVIIYPTSQAYPINPYYKSKELISGWGHPGPWTQDGWGAAVVIRAGRAFGYLAWYFIIGLRDASSERPTLDTLMASGTWIYGGAGTLSKLHLARTEIQSVGSVDLDLALLARLDPRLAETKIDRLGRSCAAGDISLGNRLIVSLPGARHRTKSGPELGMLADILRRRPP